MAQSKSCEGCDRACDCKEAYQQLGCTEGPSVTRDVSLAFLLPILAFVAFLGVFGWLLKGVVAPSYQTPLAMAIALPATAALMLAVRYLMRRHPTK